MKKRVFSKLLSVLLVLAMVLSVSTAAFAAEWNTSKSKTATNLDSDYMSKVTLSLPAAEEKLVSDVVFVLDKSTSPNVGEQILTMLKELQEQMDETQAAIHVGVVIFNKVANVVCPLTDLATGYDTIAAAIETKIESGTNTHAGLLAGKAMLDADTTVDASRKYLVFVSDGISYMFNEEPTAVAWTFWADAEKTWAGPDNWSSKYGTTEGPEDWDEWMGTIAASVEEDGTKYDYPYGGTITEATPLAEQNNHAMSIDKALYLTAQTYQEIAQEYHCYAVPAGSQYMESYPWGPAFMEYLADGEAVDFTTIRNDIFYLLDAGSVVVDEMGKTDAYDFDFVDAADDMTLTVGGEALAVTSIPVPDDIEMPEGTSITSLYVFGEVDAQGVYPYYLAYLKDGIPSEEIGECFMWIINVPVSQFSPVQLTYTVKLMNPQTEPGTYGAYDADGSKGYAELYTNNEAVLFPVDTNGMEGEPEVFGKPTVSYTVEAAPPPVENHPTGDAANMAMPAGLAAVSAVLIVVVAVLLRNSKKAKTER